jgi:hypothetical protein
MGRGRRNDKKQKIYSREIKSARSLAPATTQAEASSLIFTASVAAEDSRLSKVHALLLYNEQSETSQRSSGHVWHCGDHDPSLHRIIRGPPSRQI